MGKSQLIHNNEFHLINKAEIRKATGKLVESLNLAAGSTGGFDIYKVVDAYFTDLDKRHEINALLGIGESCQYYGEQEQVEEVIKKGFLASVGDFFSDMGKSVVDFCKGLFS